MSDLRVLVLDDDELQLDLVRRYFSSDGFIVEVSSGPETLAAEARAFAPDFVLVDVNVPGVTREGLPALVTSLRQSQDVAKILLFSAEDESRLRLLVSTTGADGYLSKGTSLPLIVTQLKTMANAPRMRRDPAD